jgi:hypothetical protein
MEARMNLIGISGRASAGKDTVADFLVRDFGFVKVALADPLKRICRDVFAFTDEQLWGPSSKRNEPDRRYPRAVLEIDSESFPGGSLAERRRTEFLTPRHALQQLGTEWGRGCYYNVWVDYAIRTAAAILSDEDFGYDPKVGVTAVGYNQNIRGVVISDVRFVNEIEAIRAAGGKVWRVLRPTSGLVGAAGQHASETALDAWGDERFDMIINNEGGSLEDLRALVKAAMG